MTCWLLLVGTLGATPSWGVDLQSVSSAALPGNQVEVTLTFSGAVAKPTSFATDSPARIALDFAGVTNKLEHKAVPIGVGAIHSLVAVEASNRTRVVVNLNEPVPYEVSSNGNQVTLKISTQGGAPSAPPPPLPPAAAAAASAPIARGGAHVATQQAAPARAAAAAAGGPVRDIDFRRGNGGEGRVVIKLPSAQTRAAVREQAGHVFVDLYDSTLPPRLFRRLDVTDFATPVTAVESKPSGRNVLLDIQTAGEYDYLAYQTDDIFTLEFRALTAAEKEQDAKKKITYTGDRLSLNFQDIEVRAVLQLLADFTGLNLIASDAVRGSITLRLKNVPWDQALDIILKSKGLGMRQTGNVIMVAPSAELAAQEKLELQSNQAIEELAPLRLEIFQINYAKAAEIAAVLTGQGSAAPTQTAPNSDSNASNPSQAQGGNRQDRSNSVQQGPSMLSERGSVTSDARTNQLLIKDTAAKLEDIRALITKLDVPVRQVMIESRIVIASNSFARDLGVRFGASGATGSLSGTQMLIGGSQPGGLTNTANYNAGKFGQDITTVPAAPFNPIVTNVASATAQGLMVNLPAAAPSGAINFLIGKVGSYLLQLELTAMQTEGRGEIISSPRVITSDGKQATIAMGQEIPYSTVSNNGTQTAFKAAVLKLDVTPQITPDDRVVMDLVVQKDAPNYAQATSAGISIDTRSVKTTVLVDNGDTVILGGVYERTKGNSKEQVPWLGDVPVLGRLFKKNAHTDDNSELLIFVTPKIMKAEMVSK
ncbi:type IV pilus secretin PilQ [uncultured Thiodictyon sp.]|uniref:type IV pilus secretin PilQ n=1 Tax=uncultured Thiodictyon sp. TaxID=1846217 RepID=UPI0025D405AD|nr:type IV pilus secretin PilQ [uncultured Thiodictyon sp.]